MAGAEQPFWTASSYLEDARAKRQKGFQPPTTLGLHISPRRFTHKSVLHHRRTHCFPDEATFSLGSLEDTCYLSIDSWAVSHDSCLV